MPRRKKTAYRTLKGYAIARKLPPGERISVAALAEEIGVSTHHVRDGLVRLAAEGWVLEAPSMGFLGLRLDASELCEYYRINNDLLVSALHAAEIRKPIQRDALARLTAIGARITGLERNHKKFAIVSGKVFLAVAALGRNRVTTAFVEKCNEHLYFIRTREPLYLDSLGQELEGICKLAVERRFMDLSQLLCDYHARRERLSSIGRCIHSAIANTVGTKSADPIYH